MMNYSMLEEARELAAWSKESEALSMYQALESIEDLRSKQGKRYELALLLTCVLLAKMAGETTLQAICEWIRYRSRWLQDVLPTTRATFPCAATSSNVLPGVDPADAQSGAHGSLNAGEGREARSRRTRACRARWQDVERNTSIWPQIKGKCII